jgi:GNAT superfamily N-acetyltransferase
MDATFRSPNSKDAAALSALCMRSKAYWGYDDAFMEACRAELMLDEADFADGLIKVAEIGGRMAGMAEISLEGEHAVLEKLFVDPPFHGQGCGARLLDWAKRLARAHGALRLIIEADPDAAAFYIHQGARKDGAVPSGSIPDRILPQLVIDLEPI